MLTFRIFTESKADVKFIKDYTLDVFGIDIAGSDFDTLNSWSGYKVGGAIDDKIKQSYDEGKQIVLILDADNNFAARMAEVTNDFQGYNIPLNLFLFPNNKDAGNLETLLSTIAVKQDILQCLDNYGKCIEQYEPLDGHERIFAYLGALLPSNNKEGNKNDLIQPKNRNYSNPAHWDLKHPSLQPLHDFMEPFLK